MTEPLWAEIAFYLVGLGAIAFAVAGIRNGFKKSRPLRRFR